MKKEIVEKIYAGFLGKCFGVRLGAPVEPQIWDYKKIREIYGDINHYTKYYKTFAADDDTNGPVFFHRMLLQKENTDEFSSEDVAKAWLNFGRENIGMFWWGGDQISTEHTAYLNLLKGIGAPNSGAIEQNGQTLAEQIGGQIFIDTWGLLFPNNPEKAALYAEKAASVSHDGDGLEGAKFMAACIASAFGNQDIKKIIYDGLKFVNPKSTYAKVVKAVIEFHEKKSDDWYSCMEYLESEWGYDKYGGVVHIIPNAGVCILAMLYGQGDYSRTIEIATMCGWDTDCNAGNVGTILGVMNGLSGLPSKYRKPTNDMIITSSVVGEMNIVDIPTFVYETAILSCKLTGRKVPDFIQHDYRLGEIHYDFSLPGATHGFVSDNYFKTELSSNQLPNGKGTLGILIDRMVEGDSSHIYNKTYYRRRDFSDERYKPCFAPQVYSNQQVEMTLYLEKWKGENVFVKPYVRNTFSQERIYSEEQQLSENCWDTITFSVPELKGSFADEVGFELVTDSPLTNRLFGRLNIGSFIVTGTPQYSIDFSKQNEEFLNITPFAHNNGQRTIEENQMVLVSDQDGCSCFTGDYYTSDIQIKCQYTPSYGKKQKIIFKAKGIRQYYSIGFNGYQEISLTRNDFQKSILQKEKFTWEEGQSYQLEVVVNGTSCLLKIDGQLVLKYDKIDAKEFGMFGFEIEGEGKAKISEIEIN